MTNRIELLKAKNGSYIAVDTYNCEWVFGFASTGDKLLITYDKEENGFISCVDEVVEMVDVIQVGKDNVILAKKGRSFLAIPDYLIRNISEGVS